MERSKIICTCDCEVGPPDHRLPLLEVHPAPAQYSTVQYSTVQCCTAPHLYRPASSARSPAIWRLERPELDMRKLYLRMRTASHEVTPPPRPPGRGGHAGVSPVGGGEAALHLVISKQVTLTLVWTKHDVYLN